MKIKRIISAALMLAIMLCVAVPAQVGATDELLNGSCGTNAYWSIFSDNVLAITGSGSINDYSSTSPKAPWAYYYSITNMGFMQKIILANGITSIGAYNFYMDSKNAYKVNSINLPDSLVSIGNNAFENEAKIQNIAIPENVTSIGTNAFAGCDSLQTVNVYCDPGALNWNISDSGLPSGCVIHFKQTYDTAEIRTKFAGYSLVFDLTKNPNTVYPNKKILASYENAHNDIFGGAHPYSIKLVDEKKNIWPITNGSRGFPTCVRYNNNYYMITDNTGVLKRVTIDPGTNRASGTTNETLSELSLKVSNEYIGNYSVKMIYTVKNTVNSDITFDMGSSGDIQIGTDDRAKIADIEYENNKIGIAMTSTHAGDADSSGNRPTLGFIGKAVGGSAADADYFYGAATMALNTSATATKADKLMPERIFNPLLGTSISSGGFSQNADSGLSFHWDNIRLAPYEEKQYAVIFTVPYTETAATDEQTAEKAVEAVKNEVESNIGDHEDDTYVTSNPERTIFFRNEQQVANDDTLAQLNGYSELQNFLLLGVQKKAEVKTGNCLRYVTVVNTAILKDANEYGYIIAKAPRSSDDTYINLRSKINRVKYDSDNIFIEDIKGTSNEVSGNYGIYNADTPYKYVTMGINDVPEDKVLVVRFYVKKGDNVKYADYYTDLNNKTDANRFDGCSADWAAVMAAAGNNSGGN